MLGLIASSVLAVAFAGIVIAILVRIFSSDFRITLGEYVVGMAFFTIIIAPIVSGVGFNMAKNDLITFNEYWGGWEVSANVEQIPCQKDGNCARTYQCEPYEVCHQVCDGHDEDGNCTGYHQECTTYYHACPYCDLEYTYTVTTTVGGFTIAANVLPDNPDAHRWTGTYDYDYNIPSWVISQAGTGIPQFWAEVNARIMGGNPGPATRGNTYNNYILPADDSLMQSYSPNIDRYLAAGLLPSVIPPASIYSFYLVDKVYFVGFTPADAQAWYEAARRFNGAFGNDLQGDLHLVIINSSVAAGEPDAYIGALRAYWQDPDVFGDNTFAKNGVLVVLGTNDGQTVSWGRATTGMPSGNYDLQIVIRDRVAGTLLTPEAILGDIHGELYVREDGKTKVRTVHSGGTYGYLEDVFWGLSDPSTAFVRQSMSADDPEDVGNGFLYLDSQIEPKPGQKTLIIAIAFVLGLMVWFGLSVVDLGDYIPGMSSKRKSYY
jgi:hypothetical protein